MRAYDHKVIEAKWREKWLKDKTYQVADSTPGKDNAYYLVEFPYPSGDLHVGHWYAFSVADIAVRLARMQGKNVMFPIGFDAFGLPAENAAIKHGVTPAEWTEKNMASMMPQLEATGASFDYSRKIATCSPDYYKWTQWLFLKLYEKGLAYRGASLVNWCPNDQTVLANEQVTNGACERCGSAVEQKEMTQWMFKITAYAEKLLSGLDDLQWSSEIKDAQRNWIGKREGAKIHFEMKSPAVSAESIFLLHGYTATSDDWSWVIEGLTRRHNVVNAPNLPRTENPNIPDQIASAISEYKGESVICGASLGAVVALKLVEALVKPIKKLVLVGAFSDPKFLDKERPFASTFNWEFDWKKIKKNADEIVILRDRNDTAVSAEQTQRLSDSLGVSVTVVDAKEPHFMADDEPSILAQLVEGVDVFTTRPDTIYGATFLVIGPEHELLKQNSLNVTNNDEVQKYIIEAAKRKTEDRFAEKDKTGVKLEGVVAINPATGKEIPVFVADYVLGDVGTGAIMAVPAHDERDNEFAKAFNLPIIEVIQLNDGSVSSGKVLTSKGILINSGECDGMTSEEATEKILINVGGTKETKYRLHDWILSRQRYWGVPIPIVYDPEGNAHKVKEEHLLWMLPTDVEFLPTGESPLKGSKELRDRVTKLYGKGWMPEFDTMDTFVDSSWYFLRYIDPTNTKAFASREKLDAWLPVDLYSGGAEHTTMHLLYSRFFSHALFDLGLVPTAEPYVIRRNRGIILGPDGHKMSKSKGNVLNPDEYVEKLGSDAVRMYLAFIGPYDETGSYPWNIDSILGVRRFLDRVWNYAGAWKGEGQKTDQETLQIIHESIRRVTESITSYAMNTGVSQLMILFNHLTSASAPALSRSDWESVIKLLAPYAPHMSEEIWEKLGHDTSVHLEAWPLHDESLLARAQVTIAIQINGKVRDTLVVNADAGKEDLERMALASDKIQSLLGTKSPSKVIVVVGRVVNIVVST